MSDIKLPELPFIPDELLRAVAAYKDVSSWKACKKEIQEYASLYARAAVEADRLKFEQALIELDNEPVGQQSSHNDAHYYGIFVDKIRRILRGGKGRP